ncbi:hypothetical protein EDB84DRAFT_1212310 [Lactarius hengduanensis]|nr:hypothetical protein EDB84DRAFT_1212310 [Lactarius hengduanensis]
MTSLRAQRRWRPETGRRSRVLRPLRVQPVSHYCFPPSPFSSLFPPVSRCLSLSDRFLSESPSLIKLQRQAVFPSDFSLPSWLLPPPFGPPLHTLDFDFAARTLSSFSVRSTDPILIASSLVPLRLHLIYRSCRLCLFYFDFTSPLPSGLCFHICPTTAYLCQRFDHLISRLPTKAFHLRLHARLCMFVVVVQEVEDGQELDSSGGVRTGIALTRTC